MVKFSTRVGPDCRTPWNVSLQAENRTAQPTQSCRESVISSAKISIIAMIQSVSNVESGDNFVLTAEGGFATVADLVNHTIQ